VVDLDRGLFLVSDRISFGGGWTQMDVFRVGRGGPLLTSAGSKAVNRPVLTSLNLTPDKRLLDSLDIRLHRPEMEHQVCTPDFLVDRSKGARPAPRTRIMWRALIDGAFPEGS